MSKAEYQADIPQYITYGPTNSKAYETGKIDDALSRNQCRPIRTTLPSCWPSTRSGTPSGRRSGSEMYVDMMTE